MNESAADGKTYSFFDNLKGVVYHGGESLICFLSFHVKKVQYIPGTACP